MVMPISVKDVVNRKYAENELIQFEYVIEGLPGPHGVEIPLRVWFERIPSESQNPAYCVRAIVHEQLYRIMFVAPSRKMTLELVVAMGLNYLKEEILEEIGFKEVLCYTIGDLTRGM